MYRMYPSSINEWMMEIRKVNAEHGWDSKVTEDNPQMFCEKMMLVVTEISEAVEEFRDHRGITQIYYGPGNPAKPEGIPIELADAIIRIFDFAEHNQIDLDFALRLKHDYNKTRPFRHGGKKA